MNSLPKGILIRLSDTTGCTAKLLSDYASGHKRPGRDRAKELEVATGIPASVWLYGTETEIKQQIMDMR